MKLAQLFCPPHKKLVESADDLNTVVNSCAQLLAEFSARDFNSLRTAHQQKYGNLDDFDNSSTAREEHYDLLVANVCKERLPFVVFAMYKDIIRESTAKWLAFSKSFNQDLTNFTNEKDANLSNVFNTEAAAVEYLIDTIYRTTSDGSSALDLDDVFYQNYDVDFDIDDQTGREPLKRYVSTWKQLSELMTARGVKEFYVKKL